MTLDEYCLTQKACANCPLDKIDACQSWGDEDITEIFKDFNIPLPAELNDETTDETTVTYPQDQEKDECRYLIPNWLLAMSEGLTKGAVKHPGETWRQIPAKEHAWRAIRHLLKYIAGDKEDDHLTNASMRTMMAWEKDRVQHENNITCSGNFAVKE